MIFIWLFEDIADLNYPAGRILPEPEVPVKIVMMNSDLPAR